MQIVAQVHPAAGRVGSRSQSTSASRPSSPQAPWFTDISSHLFGIDGKSVSLETEDTYGPEGMKCSMTRSRAQSKQGFKAKISTQVTGVIKAPNKLQRVTETIVTGLPYHPSYIDEATVFNATLKHSLDLPSVGPSVWATPLDTSADPRFLHLRLLTELNSDGNIMHDNVEAIASAPFYDAQHHLLYPTGYRVAGTVKTADPAKWFHRHGALRFGFESAVLADSHRPRFSGQIVGVEASKSLGVSVDAEGGMKATSSPLRQASALASLVGPSQGLADQSLAKTAWSRAGDGLRAWDSSAQVLHKPRPLRPSAYVIMARRNGSMLHSLLRAPLLNFL